MAKSTFVLKEPNSKIETPIYVVFRWEENSLKISTKQFKEDPNYEYFRGWDKIISFLEEVVNTGKKL